MSDKEMVSVRLHTDTKRRVERYAEEHNVSRSTAIRRLLEKGADLEETGLTVAASHQPQEDDQEEEKEAIADGGYLRLSDHPWIDPIARIGNYSALFGVILCFAALLSLFVIVPLAESIGITGLALGLGAFYAFAFLGFAMVLVSVVGILSLEVLMHPSEAPIRRYFYDQSGEVEVIPS